MSEASRNLALGHAIAHHAHPKAAPASAEDVANTAEVFNDFITNSSDTNPSATKPAPKAVTKATAPVKVVPAKKAALPVEETEEPAEEIPEEETEATGTEGPTKEDVGNAIASLINSNLKAECGALLVKVGSKTKSLSGIPPANYAKFIAGAEALLMNA
jgi:hypothetical protein